MKGLRFLYVVTCFFVLNLIAGGTLYGESSEMIEIPESIQLIENLPYCHAGYGTQRVTLELDGQRLIEKGGESPFLPDRSLESGVAFQFGCQINRIFLEYSLTENTFQLEDSIHHENSEWNSITFHQDLFSISYSFSMIPNSLYLDAGVGYGSSKYTLGNSSTDALSEEYRDSGYQFLTSLRFFIDEFLFLQWQIQKSTSSQTILDIGSRLSLNFYKRF